MTNFNKHYIKLLRDQVEVEIKYLQSMGHSQELISDPCIFCYEARRPAGDARTNGDFMGMYKCNRLKDLQQFVSQLVVREKTSNFEAKSYEYETRTLRIPVANDTSATQICKTNTNLLPPNPPVF